MRCTSVDPKGLACIITRLNYCRCLVLSARVCKSECLNQSQRCWQGDSLCQPAEAAATSHGETGILGEVDWSWWRRLSAFEASGKPLGTSALIEGQAKLSAPVAFITFSKVLWNQITVEKSKATFSSVTVTNSTTEPWHKDVVNKHSCLLM